MRLLIRPKLQVMLAPVAAALFFFSTGVNPSAQSKIQIPVPTNHVSDRASVLDDETKQRLETILENLRQRNKIEFCLAIIESTAGSDIFDFSRQLANEWDLGARTSARKSLLLVVSVNEK